MRPMYYVAPVSPPRGIFKIKPRTDKSRGGAISLTPARVLARPANSIADFFDEPRDRHPLLGHRIAIAQRHRIVFHRLMIDRDAVGRAHFVLPPIASAD